MGSINPQSIGATACVCGPIYGSSNFRRKFASAKKELEGFGYLVTTPLDTASDEATIEALRSGSVSPGSVRWKVALKKCLIRLLESDEVWLINGWRSSQGTLVEVFVARMVGIPIFELSSGHKVFLEQDQIDKVLRILGS